MFATLGGNAFEPRSRVVAGGEWPLLRLNRGEFALCEAGPLGRSTVPVFLDFERKGRFIFRSREGLLPRPGHPLGTREGVRGRKGREESGRIEG